MNINELQDLKKKIETAKSEKARAEGALEQILKTWKTDFGCSSVEEIKAKIVEVEKTITGFEEKFNTYIAEIQAILKTAEG